MKYLSAAIMAFSMATSALASDVGVSINIGQPGFYGRIDIGNVQRPQVIYTQPIVIQPSQVIVGRQPIYLRVPPGHARDWRRHCHRYYACNQPVYFVQDNWYRDVYAPRYREEHSHRGNGRQYREEVRGEHRSHERERHHEQRHERERHHEQRHEREEKRQDRGHDNGRGHGHGHGRDQRDN